LEVWEVSEVSEVRHEILAGLVVGISAIPASANPGTREYFRAAMGGPKGVSDLSALSAPSLKIQAPLDDGPRASSRWRRPVAAAPVEASMPMNIMPILCRRRSAGISHNIAQERQPDSVHGGCGTILSYRTETPS
jgi:hypothetical protein